MPLGILRISAREILYNAVALHHEQVLGYIVQEIAVVADNNQAPLEFREVFFKNPERHDVKVVGGLVKDEEIWLTHQHRCQMQAAQLASAQGVDVFLLVGR